MNMARSVSLMGDQFSRKGLNRLLIVHDRERARPIRAPQAAIKAPSIEYASQRIPNIWKRVMARCDNVQAPLTLITGVWALGEFQASGRSAQGCGGAGGTRGCSMPQMVNDQSRLWMAVDERSARFEIAPAENVDRQSQNGEQQRAVIRSGSRGRQARAALLCRQHDANSQPRLDVLFQSAMTSATAGSSGSTGLTIAEAVGMGPAALPLHSWRRSDT